MIATLPTISLEIRPARPEDTRPILLLHCEAFADKFGAAFGAHGVARGVEAMAEAWRRQGISALRGMFVACSDQQVIGTITLRTWEMGHEDAAAAEMAFHQVLGPWGALRSFVALSLLDHTISRDEGYLTDVAVHSAYRRRGVAQAMLLRAEEEARLRRKKNLSLYVSAANQGAHQLYRRVGFHDIRLRTSLLAGVLLRRLRWIYMHKPIAEYE
jgi:ribosomal protein S18 acetylase RimI-like enzyme